MGHRCEWPHRHLPLPIAGWQHCEVRAGPRRLWLPDLSSRRAHQHQPRKLTDLTYWAQGAKLGTTLH
eukprot:10860592-Prorocentrum_lima.AAC.1